MKKLTIAEAAIYLGITKNRMYNLCHDGIIKMYKVQGRATYVYEDDIQRYKRGEIMEANVNYTAGTLIETDATAITQKRKSVKCHVKHDYSFTMYTNDDISFSIPAYLHSYEGEPKKGFAIFQSVHGLLVVVYKTDDTVQFIDSLFNCSIDPFNNYGYLHRLDSVKRLDTITKFLHMYSVDVFLSIEENIDRTFEVVYRKEVCALKVRSGKESMLMIEVHSPDGSVIDYQNILKNQEEIKLNTDDMRTIVGYNDIIYLIYKKEQSNGN